MLCILGVNNVVANMSKTKILRVRNSEHAYEILVRIAIRLDSTPSMASKLPKEVLQEIGAVVEWLNRGGK